MTIFEGNRPGSIVGDTDGYETRLAAAAAKAAILLKAKSGGTIKQQPEKGAAWERPTLEKARIRTRVTF